MLEADALIDSLKLFSAGVWFAGKCERVEAKNCGVCRRTRRPRIVSYFLSRFLRSDIPGHQRFAADRTFRAATRANGVVRGDGDARLNTGMRASVFSGEEGRGSALSPESWPPWGENSALGREKWICRDAGCRITASSNAI